MAGEQNGRLWTIGEVLRWTQGHFAQKGIDSARLDAELLLAHVLKVNRIYLYTHYEQPLSNGEREAYRTLVLRRAKREPVAYILGQREFYGHTIAVTRDVLIPRPETEHLVDAVIEWIRAQALEAPRIADLCTGSGAVAVALGLALPGAHLVATDISKAALTVAERNVAEAGLLPRCTVLLGDLLAPLIEHGLVPVDVIVANPPYVAEVERASLAPEIADYEPEVALFAGTEGVALIRRLCTEAWQCLRPAGLLAIEIGSGQRAAVLDMLGVDGHYDNIRVCNDLAGRPRIATAQRRA